jgi:hypothetical protein
VGAPVAIRAQDAYPPPLPTPTASSAVIGQPGYPVATADPFLENLDAAGASPAVVIPDQPPPAAAPDTSDGLLFLWTGFIAALLVFATGIVGSLLLFTRRSE